MGLLVSVVETSVPRYLQFGSKGNWSPPAGTQSLPPDRAKSFDQHQFPGPGALACCEIQERVCLFASRIPVTPLLPFSPSPNNIIAAVVQLYGLDPAPLASVCRAPNQSINPSIHPSINQSIHHANPRQSCFLFLYRHLPLSQPHCGPPPPLADRRDEHTYQPDKGGARLTYVIPITDPDLRKPKRRRRLAHPPWTTHHVSVLTACPSSIPAPPSQVSTLVGAVLSHGTALLDGTAFGQSYRSAVRGN